MISADGAKNTALVWGGGGNTEKTDDIFIWSTGQQTPFPPACALESLGTYMSYMYIKLYSITYSQ